MTLGKYEVVNTYYSNGKVHAEKPVFVVEERENYSDANTDYYFDYFNTEEEATMFYNDCHKA